MQRKPRLVSVIVPVRNEEPRLASQLAALGRQTYAEPWEVLVCDNGSTDGTVSVARRFHDRVPGLRIVDVSDRVGLNHTRNAGVQHAGGDFVAFCDGDDTVSPGWLAALVRAAGRADIAAGPVVPIHDDYVHFVDAAPVKHGFLPAVAGGNCGMWVDVARAVPWDESFVFAGSDIEWSWRAVLDEHTIATAPDAIVNVDHDESSMALAHRWFRYGASGGLLFRVFRDRGMPRSSVSLAVRVWAWLLVHLPDLVRNHRARQRWVRVFAYRTGRLAGSVRHRVAYP